MKTTAEGVPWQSIITVSPAVRAATAALYMADGTAILIDLGVSLRRITTALKALSLTLEDISAVVLTHEHIDHVKGLPMFLKKCRRRRCFHRGTAEAFEEKESEYAEPFEHIDSGGALLSGSGMWTLCRFRRRMTVPRARAIFEHGGSRFGFFATDLGFVLARMRPSFCAAVKWSLRANHDPHMLQAGPYLYSLKMRCRTERAPVQSGLRRICSGSGEKAARERLCWRT